jgi:long-chain acyl-CoA synthetase
MSVGGGEFEHVTALVAIDFENVAAGAELLTYTTFVDLAQKPEVYELIRKDVEQVNQTLPPGGRVRKFVLLHKEFDADEAEMTRTRKLRRGFRRPLYMRIEPSIAARTASGWSPKCATGMGAKARLIPTFAS